LPEQSGKKTAPVVGTLKGTRKRRKKDDPRNSGDDIPSVVPMETREKIQTACIEWTQLQQKVPLENDIKSISMEMSEQHHIPPAESRALVVNYFEKIHKMLRRGANVPIRPKPIEDQQPPDPPSPPPRTLSVVEDTRTSSSKAGSGDQSASSSPSSSPTHSPPKRPVLIEQHPTTSSKPRQHPTQQGTSTPTSSTPPSPPNPCHDSTLTLSSVLASRDSVPLSPSSASSHPPVQRSSSPSTTTFCDGKDQQSSSTSN